MDIGAALDLMLQVCGGGLGGVVGGVAYMFPRPSTVGQCSSTELTCESGAVLAASLANGGLCPLSGDQVLSPMATRSMLSMMQAAGMKEYSAPFQFKVRERTGCSTVVITLTRGAGSPQPTHSSF